MKSRYLPRPPNGPNLSGLRARNPAKLLPRGQLELRVNQELPDPTRRIVVCCEFGHDRDVIGCVSDSVARAALPTCRFSNRGAHRCGSDLLTWTNVRPASAPDNTPTT